MGNASVRRIAILDGEDRFDFALRAGALTLDGAAVSIAGDWIPDGTFDAIADGGPISGVVLRENRNLFVFVGDDRFALKIDDPLAATGAGAADTGSLFARMPGVVVAVHVADGAQVTAGTPLLAVEAMKVEHTIRAPADGTVTAVHFKQGERVSEGAELISFEVTGNG
jgi:3-methylcrotonyl-CoA carboxylase alpha subunit